VKKKFLGVLLAIAICEAVGSIGSIFTIPAIGLWYAGLAKAPLNPPNWIFGPVWTTLFALMGVAAYLVWSRRRDKSVKPALLIFILQLLFNVFWSILFFGGHAPLAAAIEIIFLWIAILWTIIAFWKINRTAAWLLLPYLLWVTFAAYLNYSVFLLN
jgi:tryptophan-rich sensory protein